MVDKNNERIGCEACDFKYLKDEMLEKEIKNKEGEVEKSEWYCRRCAPWHMGKK